MIPNGHLASSHGPGPLPIQALDDDTVHDRYLLKLRSYEKALPYSIESNSRYCQCIYADRVTDTVGRLQYNPIQSAKYCNLIGQSRATELDYIVVPAV